jgi:hypothetical protein
LLNGCLSARPHDCPAQNATCFTVYDRQNVDSVFLSPIKVKISSISASMTSAGMGALDKASFQDSLVAWAREYICECSAYSGIFASPLLFSPLYFDGFLIGNVNTLSFLYFSPFF